MVDEHCLKGFWITPNELIGENGDVDEPTFWEGETLEKAIQHTYRKGNCWICGNCNTAFAEQEEAQDCCSDEKHD